MTGTLTVQVWDRDPDYLGIDIHAANERFAGTARLYAPPSAATELADRLDGFPKSPRDERKFEFGSRKSGVAGGFCSLRFHCTDGAGHARVDVMMEDDANIHEPANATFGFRVFPLAIDEFTTMLRKIDKNLLNKALLSSHESMELK